MGRLLNVGVGALLAMGVAGSVSAATVLPMYTDLPGKFTGHNVNGFPIYFENGENYAFTAAVSGDIWAYYTGSSASDSEWLGLKTGPDLSHLTDTGFHGLENHTPPPITPANPLVITPLGTAFDLGHVNAGQLLVFYIQDLNPERSSQRFYSDKSLNPDGALLPDGVTHAPVQHVYSTSFTAGNGANNVSTGGDHPIEFSVPTGVYTYLGFEDLPGTDRFADFNYHDETFLFRQIADPTPPPSPPSEVTAGIPEPATWGLMLLGFGGLGVSLRRARAKGLATA